MRAKTKRIKRVLVALWTGSVSGRDILGGLFRYVHRKARWDFVLVQLPNGFRPETVEEACRAGLDGIIASDFSPPQIRRLVETTDIPVISIGSAPPPTRPCGGPVASVNCDDRAIGTMAARHFLSLGVFNGFGFLGATAGTGEKNERAAGFIETLARSGRDCSVFTAPTGAGDRMDEGLVATWLESLPKPAAVLCHYDPLAVQVLNICRDRSIAVPEQVSVLGVDNDPLLCDFAEPPLSSVEPDHEGAGFAAARELDRLFAYPRRPPRDANCAPVGIVERESTRPLAPAGHLVRAARAFIERNATSGIGVADVVANLKVSRRLVDLRFREIENCTIAQAIEGRRMAVAEKLLKETSRTIRRIAADCGYASANTFGIAFRKRHGVSPGTFRRSFKSGKGK